MNKYKKVNIVICISIFFLVVVNSLLFANASPVEIPLEIKITDKGINKLISLDDNSCKNQDAELSNILQLVENVLNYISILITLFIMGAGLWFFKSQQSLKKKLTKAEQKLNIQYEKIKVISLKAEEQFLSQYDEIEILSGNVKDKLTETENHLAKLDKIDELTKTKISAIQQTLIYCLEKAPTRDVAFATYSKLLAAYEVLLDNSLEDNINYKLQEEMEMAATLVAGNKQYVPQEIIRFMIEEMNLPYEVRGILWGSNN